MFVANKSSVQALFIFFSALLSYTIMMGDQLAKNIVSQIRLVFFVVKDIGSFIGEPLLLQQFLKIELLQV